MNVLNVLKIPSTPIKSVALTVPKMLVGVILCIVAAMIVLNGVKKTILDRIKIMTVEEMAEFFAVDKYPNFPSSPCYICEHDRGMFCNKPSNCTDEDKIQIYQKWLESDFIEEPKKECIIEMCVEDCEDCGFCKV